MAVLGELFAFLEGLKSVIDVSGSLKGTLSNSISEGMQAGFNKVKPAMARLVLASSVLFTGIFLMGYGLGSAFEAITHLPGMGFAVSGTIFIVMGAAILYSMKG